MSQDLTIQDVMKREEVSRQTVYDWFAKGLHSRKKRRKGLRWVRVVNVVDLETFLDQNGGQR